MKLTAVQALILSKAFSDDELKELRASVPPGEYAEAFTLDVAGGIKVGKDSEQKPRIDWKAISGWLLERVNPAIREALVREYQQAHEGATKLPGGELADTVEGTLDAWLEKHKTPRKGQVRGACVLKVINPKAEAA